MTGWNVSRHPEWDMMYRAGLTIREIAEHCHANVATVSLHLKVRDKYEPNLKDESQAALSKRHPDRPTTRWRQTCKQVIEFYAANQRLPERSSTAYENSMHEWLLRQRRSFERNQMSPGKIHLLEDLPGWRINQEKDNNERLWHSNLLSVVKFVNENNRFPKYHNYTSVKEKHLGIWLHNQHQKRSSNKLTNARLAALEECLPGWRSFW
ncbi:helicase associated domain-containing protein [Glutamicibacter uratoxydans]|uniref:helicase associated domain-containing protein n=1 Tax=Glutamicibacter uratoxydans TaxID=43667 RepID=UPI0011450F21|nr:helicase associated domain-containing protein [Glutamicibacter uratoxydans]